MKKLFVLFTLLTSTIAIAKPAKPVGVLNYHITHASYSEAHFANAGGGSIVLDYNKRSVTLSVIENACPPNAYCILMVPPPTVVSLPVTKIERDNCNNLIVTASKDKRPADGALSQIRLLDSRGNTCKTALKPNATYQTVFIDRINRKSISNKSYMRLDLVTKK